MDRNHQSFIGRGLLGVSPKASLLRFVRTGLLAAFMVSAAPAFGASFTWTGGNTAADPVTGNWSVSTNWSGGVVPSTTTSAGAVQYFYFGGSGSTAYTATVNIATNQSTVYLPTTQFQLNSTATVMETITGNALYMVGGSAGIYQNSTGDFTITNKILLGSSGAFTGSGSGSVTLSGVLDGLTLTLSNTGSALLTLSGANTFKGLTVKSGIVDLKNASAAGANSSRPDSTGLTINGGTLLSSNGVTLGKYTGTSSNSATKFAGDFTLSGNVGWSLGSTAVVIQTSSRTITANTGGTGAVVGGAIDDGGLGLGLTISADSTGTLKFTGANTYKGATIVNGGKLIINGTHTGAGAYTVNSGGTLGGTGSITTDNADVTVVAGGKISPGDESAAAFTFSLGTGTFYVADAVTALNSGAFTFTLDGVSTSDKIVLSSGTFNIGAGLLELDDFAFTLGSSFGVGTYTLIDSSSLISGSLGTNLTGVINGYNVALELADSGQDIVLTVTVPEPGDAMLVSLGILLIAAIRFRGALRLGRN